MQLDDELICDGCSLPIPVSPVYKFEEDATIMITHNRVTMNSADYDLCEKCYQKLLGWFNENITI